jgi:hypothetical protein
LVIESWQPASAQDWAKVTEGTSAQGAAESAVVWGVVWGGAASPSPMSAQAGLARVPGQPVHARTNGRAAKKRDTSSFTLASFHIK